MLCPVRILVASDVHYRLQSLDWLCEVSGDYDALILAGDLLDVGNPVPVHAQIVVLENYLQRLVRSDDSPCRVGQPRLGRTR